MLKTAFDNASAAELSAHSAWRVSGSIADRAAYEAARSARQAAYRAWETSRLAA